MLCHQGSCHQQSGQVLAGNIALDPDGVVLFYLGRLYPQGRIAWGLQILYLCPSLIQGLNQIPDGSLMHSLDARKLIMPMRPGQRRRQGAHRCPCITQIKLCLRGDRIPSSRDAVMSWRHFFSTIPKRSRESSITTVSSDSSTPVSVVVPWAMAARSNARFDMLFEPGS